MRCAFQVFVALVMATTAAFAADYTGYAPSDVKGESVADLTAQKICSIKWGEDQRHVTDAMKAEVSHREGYSGNDDPRCDNPKSTTRRCEVDHLISRELGGADTVANLWIQPYAGPWSATDKDRLENRLGRELCAKPTPATLAAVRAAITGDWHKAYRTRFGDPKGQPGACAK
jgi:hypothetical protein